MMEQAFRFKYKRPPSSKVSLKKAASFEEFLPSAEGIKSHEDGVFFLDKPRVLDSSQTVRKGLRTLVSEYDKGCPLAVMRKWLSENAETQTTQGFGRDLRDYIATFPDFQRTSNGTYKIRKNFEFDKKQMREEFRNDDSKESDESDQFGGSDEGSDSDETPRLQIDDHQEPEDVEDDYLPRDVHDSDEEAAGDEESSNEDTDRSSSRGEDDEALDEDMSALEVAELFDWKKNRRLPMERRPTTANVNERLEKELEKMKVTHGVVVLNRLHEAESEGGSSDDMIRRILNAVSDWRLRSSCSYPTTKVQSFLPFNTI